MSRVRAVGTLTFPALREDCIFRPRLVPADDAMERRLSTSQPSRGYTVSKGRRGIVNRDGDDPRYVPGRDRLRTACWGLRLSGALIGYPL